MLIKRIDIKFKNEINNKCSIKAQAIRERERKKHFVETFRAKEKNLNTIQSRIDKITICTKLNR